MKTKKWVVRKKNNRKLKGKREDLGENVLKSKGSDQKQWQ